MSNKKVLLINPNLMKPVVSPFPIDYLSTALKVHQIEVTFLDLAFSQDIEKEIKWTLQNDEFEAVEITVRNIDDSYLASQDFCLERTKVIIDQARIYTSVPVILGGAGFYRELALWMKKAGCVGIDFGVDSGNAQMLKNLG
ncbi:MAG: hypothetical protein N3A64_05575 [Desulfobacterota bacterium]|nr:hypothetical protein [Thermodesulfobacteriota bacterium]